MSYSKPDLIINGVMIDRVYSPLGPVYHYMLRFKRHDGTRQQRLVNGPLYSITSAHQPIPIKLDDQEEIEFLTRVINEQTYDQTEGRSRT